MISRDEFEETFQPRAAPSGEPLWSWEEARHEPVTHVWTIVTGDDNESEYAMPGYHVVNRVGYVVTVQPWRDETLDAVWYERDAMTLIERIYNEMASDDDNYTPRQSDLLIEAYDTADQAGKHLLDTAFICLCGWSLKHLIEDTDDDTEDDEEGASERG